MLLKNSQKLQISIKSFNPKFLHESYKKIIELINKTDCKVIGPIFLPTKRRIYCLLRSPHVDKNSREHFEIRIYKRIVEIYYNPSINIIKELANLNFPSGVFCKIKVK